MANLMAIMLKAVAKRKLGVGKINGTERFMLSQLGMADRIPTTLGATNIEPHLIDPKYNYTILAKSPEANLELFEKVCERVDADLIVAPVWQGLMFFGTAELGTEFKITDDRVPYSVGYPIKTKEDIEKIKLPEAPAGYFKMYLDITKEAQRRRPDLLFTMLFDGPWDLAMLLRGDDKLPLDMRLYKDYVETDDPIRKEKIRKRGNPDIYPAIMELTTKLAIQHISLAVKYGMSLTGAMLVDQYAASPIMSRQDYVKYVLPYIERVWLHHKKKVQIMYPCPSPNQMQEIMEKEPDGINHQILWANYIFPTTPEGITLPEFDRPVFELAKKYKKNFSYFLHGKFLRDATELEIEQVVKRVCTLAVQMGVSLSFIISSVPPGASLEKANFTFQMVQKYGRY